MLTDASCRIPFFPFVLHLSRFLIWWLLGSFTESELGEIRFPEISTPILEKVCQYFYYKLRYTNRYVLVYVALFAF